MLVAFDGKPHSGLVVFLSLQAFYLPGLPCWLIASTFFLSCLRAYPTLGSWGFVVMPIVMSLSFRRLLTDHLLV